MLLAVGLPQPRLALQRHHAAEQPLWRQPLLQQLRIEPRDHRLQRRAHAGQQRQLVRTQVAEGIGHCLQRRHEAALRRPQHVGQRRIGIRRELQRVVLARAQQRGAGAELALGDAARGQQLQRAGQHGAQQRTDQQRLLR